MRSQTNPLQPRREHLSALAARVAHRALQYETNERALKAEIAELQARLRETEAEIADLVEQAE